MTFHLLVRGRIQELNITITEAAKRCGMLAQHLNQIHNGRVPNPRLELVLRILKGLELPLDALLPIFTEVSTDHPKYTRPLEL